MARMSRSERLLHASDFPLYRGLRCCPAYSGSTPASLTISAKRVN